MYTLAKTGATSDFPAAYPYAHAASLHDVTSGTNGACGGLYLCTALAGYDGPTGLGTPNGVAAFTSAPASADFSLAVSPGSQTLTAGASGAATVTLTPAGGFSGPVTLTTSVSPSAAWSRRSRRQWR